MVKTKLVKKELALSETVWRKCFYISGIFHWYIQVVYSSYLQGISTLVNISSQKSKCY